LRAPLPDKYEASFRPALTSNAAIDDWEGRHHRRHIPTCGDMRMEAHFWPALYPGLIVGLLYGLSLRGLVNIVAGTLGGLVGSAIAYWASVTFGFDEGLVSVVSLVVLAFLGAVCAVYIARQITGASTTDK
jgi:uncharacterized membrane protein YeaQ/YmgE (transglycosylase-associated protein family)